MSMSEGTTEKKRRSLPSMLSRFSDTVSVRSRTSSFFAKMHKGILGAEHNVVPQMRLRWRDWLLAFAELCMSFSWGSFMAQAQSERTLKMRNMTQRDETIQRLFCSGFVGIGNLLMGHLADSYTKNYGIVIINIAGHFTLSTLFFMSEVISETASEDEYGLLLSDIFVWLYIPIRATDFARAVYGMEQLAGKSGTLVLYFSFVLQLASQTGSFLFLVFNSSSASFHIVTFIAFTANGFVLYLYAYVLLPQKAADLLFSRGIATKLWGSVITALSNKRKFHQRIKKKSWMDFAENRYDKTQVLKTKSLIKLFLMILPTFGFMHLTGSNDDIFDLFWEGLNHSGKSNTYRLWGVTSASLLSMLAFEQLVIPLLACMRVRISLYRRFLLGYVALIIALFFAAITTHMTEKLHIDRDVAILRMYNTKRDPVAIDSYDYVLSSLNYTVSSLSSKMVTYNTRSHRLLKVCIRLINGDSYIMHVSLTPYSMIGYLFVDPDVVYRIRGKIPILEAPPGMNNKHLPTCFVANFIPGKAVVLDLKNMDTGEKSQVPVDTGAVAVFQVVEGKYKFRVRDTLARVFYEVLIGGVYGVYIYLDLEDYRINVDKIIPENTTPALMGLGVSIPMGVANGVGRVALVVLVFTSSPDGLKGIALGYLFFLGQIASWAVMFGFYTWHHYISAFTLLMYSLITTCLFFASLVLIIKYRNIYKS